MYAMALAAALAASQPATPPAVPPAEQAPPAVAVQQPPHIPDLAEIMAIPPELRVLLQERVIAPGGTRQEQLERLVVLVFDQTALAIEYDNDRTRTVAETWRDRRANCVSYTLLFVALARAAGMDAYVQEAGEVLAWYREPPLPDPQRSSHHGSDRVNARITSIASSRGSTKAGRVRSNCMKDSPSPRCWRSSASAWTRLRRCSWYSSSSARARGYSPASRSHRPGADRPRMPASVSYQPKPC